MALVLTCTPDGRRLAAGAGTRVLVSGGVQPGGRQATGAAWRQAGYGRMWASLSVSRHEAGGVAARTSERQRNRESEDREPGPDVKA
jgi:hypothetical protein